MAKWKCPGCGHEFPADEPVSGNVVKCPKCANIAERKLTEEEKLLLKHYGREPGDDSLYTPQMLKEIQNGRRKMRKAFSPTGEDMARIHKAIETGEAVELIDEKATTDLLFRNVNRRLWGKVKMKMFSKGVTRKKMVEEALKLWLGDELKENSSSSELGDELEESKGGGPSEAA